MFKYQYERGEDDLYSEEVEEVCMCDNECTCCECTCECGCDMEVGPMGPQGPKGAQGPRGPQGPRGLQGQQGREGIQGPRGVQGVTGLQGEPGIQGPTGATGVRGLNGETGATGVMGPTGPQGPQGVQGNTGPAGQDAAVLQFASASLRSYTDKELCPGEALTFDISNIQRGFTVTDEFTSLCAAHQGTYVIQFGCFVNSDVCMGDAIALKINDTMIVDESRMPIVPHNSSGGTIILTLHANDRISMVAESNQELSIRSCNDTINAYLLIYQINS